MSLWAISAAGWNNRSLIVETAQLRSKRPPKYDCRCTPLANNARQRAMIRTCGWSSAG